jgi:hypothetical protein
LPMLADSAATIAFAALALILLRFQPSPAVWPRRVRPLPAPAVRHSGSPALLAVRYPGAARSTIVRCSRCRWLPTTLPASLPPSRCPALRCVACGGGVDRVRYDGAAVELRTLLVMTAGGQQNGTGWPSRMLELTCQRFDVGPPAHDAELGSSSTCCRRHWPILFAPCVGRRPKHVTDLEGLVLAGQIARWRMLSAA